MCMECNIYAHKDINFLISCGIEIKNYKKINLNYLDIQKNLNDIGGNNNNDDDNENVYDTVEKTNNYKKETKYIIGKNNLHSNYKKYK